MPLLQSCSNEESNSTLFWTCLLHMSAVNSDESGLCDGVLLLHSDADFVITNIAFVGSLSLTHLKVALLLI